MKINLNWPWCFLGMVVHTKNKGHFEMPNLWLEVKHLLIFQSAWYPLPNRWTIMIQGDINKLVSKDASLVIFIGWLLAIFMAHRAPWKPSCNIKQYWKQYGSNLGTMAEFDSARSSSLAVVLPSQKDIFWLYHWLRYFSRYFLLEYKRGYRRI